MPGDVTATASARPYMWSQKRWRHPLGTADVPAPFRKPLDETDGVRPQVLDRARRTAPRTALQRDAGAAGCGAGVQWTSTASDCAQLGQRDCPAPAREAEIVGHRGGTARVSWLGNIGARCTVTPVEDLALIGPLAISSKSRPPGSWESRSRRPRRGHGAQRSTMVPGRAAAPPSGSYQWETMPILITRPPLTSQMSSFRGSVAMGRRGTARGPRWRPPWRHRPGGRPRRS